RRIETRIDFRKFIRAYNTTLAPGERFGKPDEWRIDVLVAEAHNPTLYLSSPLFSDRMRKKWIKLSPAQLAARSARLGSGLAAQLAEFLPDVNSPFSYFKALGKRAVPAKELDRIDGAETRGYSETVDVRPYLRALPGFMQKILAGSSTKMDAVIWVDGTSNVRRIELLSAPIRGADGALMSDMTDVDQLGGRVRIQIPPPADVVDATSLPKT